MLAAIREHDMTFLFPPLLLSTLLGGSLMHTEQPHQSLQIEVSEFPAGTIAVSLTANSSQAQRVTYEMQTIGTSTSTHKGSTFLRADDLATLSTVRFSAGNEWCVSLTVEEELGSHYTITKGSACS